MNVFAKFDEIPSMTLQDIKEIKHFLSFVRSDNVKTVYPGLENCTRPLVFTSGSWVRASGNFQLLAQQDEWIFGGVRNCFLFFCEKCKK